MNKHIGILLLLGIVTFDGIGQKLGIFKEGYVVSHKGDTIKGLILVDPLVMERIAYKENHDDFQKTMPAKKIRCIITANQYFEKIKAGKKEWIMTLSVSGKDSLFSYLIQENVNSVSTKNGYLTASNINYRYWIKSGGSFYEITTKNYKEELSKLLSGCDAVKEILQSDYQYNDIPKIVTTSNNCP